ncbi:thioredoxin [Malaciobacter mytili]|uniref:thioredoxin family protein n=1 Tax=Malaciobacter mytili TaxID=603050 RepID=UPI00100AEC47|nr:thioredoxin family protein [Malaciobacter mytili]RXI48811.1 thioredoxin [Malaciobacter mytili]
MKKISLLIFLFFSFLFSEELIWIDSFSKAKELALKENKKILVMFTQENCPTCEYMKDVTFQDEYVLNYMQTNFILVQKDIKQKDELVNLKVYGTPTTYIFSKEAKQIGRQIIGGATPSAFLKVLKEYK